MSVKIIIELESKWGNPTMVSAGYNADWLVKQIPEIVYNEKGATHRVGDDYRVVSVSQSKST